MTEIDLKPLLTLLKPKQLDELTPRIQRFHMRLMRFSYEITHTVGKKLYDSRQGAVQLKNICSRRQKWICLSSIIENIFVSNKRLEEIRQEQNTDSICRQVINYYKMDNWPEAARKDPKPRPY